MELAHIDASDNSDRDCGSIAPLGASDGMVGRLCSRKFIVLRHEGLGRGDMDAALLSIENAAESRLLYASGSYSFTKIWFAARILRGARPPRERLYEERRDMGAMGRAGGGAGVVEAAKF